MQGNFVLSTLPENTLTKIKNPVMKLMLNLHTNREISQALTGKEFKTICDTLFHLKNIIKKQNHDLKYTKMDE